MAIGSSRFWGAIAGLSALAALPAGALSQDSLPPQLPELPPTPQMSDEPYPDCREDWQDRGDAYERAEETNRCTERLDSYNAGVLVPFREAMIEHQGEIARIYTDQVQNDFAFTQDQRESFFAAVTREHEASNPDGAHFETYREMEARYQADRTYQQDTFCSYVQCEGRPPPTALARGEVRGDRRRARDRSDDCGTERTGGGLLGGLLGGLAGDRLGIGTVGGFIAGQFTGVLVAEIACQLTEEEQELAAEATEEVTQQEEVGTTASWTSPTRGDVSGSSTVTALNSEPNGATCLQVTDIVIIDGEEISAEKTMCRQPGETRYTLQA